MDEITAHQRSAARSAETRASVADALEAAQLAEDAGALVLERDTETFGVSAADASFTDNDESIRDLAIHSISGLRRGQAVRLVSDGRWSPTCALSEAGAVRSPYGSGAAQIELADVETSSECNLYGYAGNNPVSHIEPRGYGYGSWISSKASSAWGGVKTGARFAGGVAKAAGKAAWGAAKGTYSAVRHPVRTAKAIGHAVTNPRQTARAVYRSGKPAARAIADAIRRPSAPSPKSARRSSASAPSRR